MGVIEVDDKFARFGGKSYAINKINSVEVRQRKPYGKGAAVLCGIIALMALLQAAQVGLAAVVVGLAFAGLAYWSWQRSKVTEYQLFLMTSSSEAQAFVTRNGAEVFALRDQIEAAIAAS